MIVNPILNSGDKAIIGIVLCGLLVLAAIILPKVFRYKKRMKAKQEIESEDVEILVVQEPEKLITEQKSSDYASLFLVNTEITARSGKQVGIRQTYHNRIAKIVRVIGKRDVTIFSYIDNVLKHHFDTFQNEISELYHKNKDDDYLNPKK